MRPERRELALSLVRAALEAVDPAAAVTRALPRVDAGRARRVRVVGAGKAAVPMARAVELGLDAPLQAGRVITKHGHAVPPLPRHILVREAAHPVPDRTSVQATAWMLELLDHGPGVDDLVLCLISGGGSALMTLPAPGIRLVDLQRTTELLLAGGVPIEQVNGVRKHLSQVKGGQLAARAAPARVAALILSDVVGNPVDAIASGPTAADPTTFDDALEVLRRHDLLERVPAAVRAHLEAGARGERPETPVADDPLLERVDNLIVGSNARAAEAALARARELGLAGLLLSTHVEGEAREVGRVCAALLRELAQCGRPLPRPACLVLGGETTVTMTEHGAGGRNQELALAAALALDGLQDVCLVALATDGNDGPTDAGGAVVDGTTAARARAAGLDPHDHLQRHDAYPLLDAVGDLLRIGPTGTNVNDLTLLLAF